jgi:hypothetical protein
MALLPMGSATDQFEETQQSIFEDASGFPSHDYVEAEGHAPGEPEHLEAYEPEELTSDNEPVSQAGAEVGVDSEAEPVSAPASGSISSPVFGQISGPGTGPESSTDSDSLGILTVDDFAALEDRVLRAVNLVRRERKARVAAEEQVIALETQLLQAQSKTPVIEQLQVEVDALRAEREQVRQRVERLLAQLDALEL